MNGSMNHGRAEVFSDEQIAEALRRVNAVCGTCSFEAYLEHRLPTEPSPWGIIYRYKRFNAAKVAAGLPIVVKVQVKKKPKAPVFETELKPAKRSTYPCHKCKQPFKGLGRRNGNHHCPSCAEENNRIYNSMGW